MHKIVTSLAMMLALAAVDARANLITNGSFEAPVVPVGSFSTYTAGERSITGWTVTGPQVSIVSGTYAPGGGFTFPAEDGDQWLDLTGDFSNAFEGVKQTVNTVAGTEYDLSFYLGNVSGSIWGTTSTVEVQINSLLAGTAVNSTPGATLTWEQFTIPFLATSSSTVIEFDNLDPVDDNSNGLDNVDLEVAAPAPVPEPSSMMLLGFGLLGLAGLVRRSRAR